MIKSLKKHWVRIVLGLVLTLFFSIENYGLFNIPFIGQLDNIIYDARLKLTMPKGVDERIVILDVDEKSLNMPELGRWPWSRDKMSKIMDNLFDYYEVKEVGFDVIWAEADQSSGLGKLQDLAKKELKNSKEFSATLEKIAPKLDYDGMFAHSLQDRPVVLGYYFNSNDDATIVGSLPDPSFTKEDMLGYDVQLPLRKGYGANLPILMKDFPLAGHFNPTVDQDGKIRRVPLIAQFGDNYYESLSMAMFRLAKGVDHPDFDRKGHMPDNLPGPVLMPEVDPKQSSNKLPIEAVAIGSTLIPTDTITNVMVPYRGGRGSFKYMSLGDIYYKKIPEEQLKNKIILIGTTAPGLADLRATPVGGLYPGVEVHANLIAGMLDSDLGVIKSTPSYMSFLLLVAIFVLGIVLSFMIAMMSAGLGVGVFVISIIASVAVNFYAWNSGFALPLASFLMLSFLIYLTNVGYGYFVESRGKRQLTDLFGQYVPPELVDKMAEDPLKYSMAARKTQLTVLFADIVGFTSISEGLTPQELTEFVNGYLTEMSFVIRSNGGTLDKYIGDAIMAFWGAPIDDANHGYNGVLTSLKMQEKLAELRASYKERGWPDIKVGLGLSSGDMTVGDMGSKIRKAYTVMGDNVNLGSRLEGATRQYGVWILVSEATKNIAEGILFRAIDMVRVKGKNVPIRIFEPIGVEKELSDEKKEQIYKWNDMFALYQKQAWDEAQAILDQLLVIEPDFKLYKVFAERIAFFKANPPGDDWDGVTKFETK